MLINTVGVKGTSGKWCMLAGYPSFPILTNRGSPFGFYTGGKISTPRKERNNQSVNAQAPAQLQLNLDRFYDSTLGCLDSLYLVMSLRCCLLPVNESRTHDHSHY